MKESDFFNEDGTLKNPLGLEEFLDENGNAKTFLQLIEDDVVKPCPTVAEWLVRISAVIGIITNAHYHGQAASPNELQAAVNSMAAMMPIEILMLSGITMEKVTQQLNETMALYEQFNLPESDTPGDDIS